MLYLDIEPLSSSVQQVIIIFSRRMLEGKLLQDHKAIYLKFYKSIVSLHPRAKQLQQRLSALLNKIGVQEGDDFFFRSFPSKRKPSPEPMPQMQSLRITHNSSKGGLDISRSKSSRKSDRSSDRPQNQAKFLGVSWVYSSNEKSRVLVFALLASFILTQNSVGFLKLQDNINDQLSQGSVIPPILMLSINKYWQQILQVVTRKKSYFWQKHIKEPIDRMPLEFNKLIAQVLLGQPLAQQSFTTLQAQKLSKEGKINVSYFTLNFRELSTIQNQGNFGSKIVIGYIKHSRSYVIANKKPQYSDIQLRNRKIKEGLLAGIDNLLQQYHRDALQLDLPSQPVPNQKQKIVKDFFDKKMALLKNN